MPIAVNMILVFFFQDWNFDFDEKLVDQPTNLSRHKLHMIFV